MMAVRQHIVDRYKHMSHRGLADHCQHIIDETPIDDVFIEILNGMAKVPADPPRWLLSGYQRRREVETVVEL